LLISGRYPAQSRLPPERELAVLLGVSRSGLREGLEILEAEGRIWRHVGKGTFVGPRPIQAATGLDLVSARRVDRLIRELSERLGVTCVVVSHDLTSIFSIATRIAMLYKGRVRLLGTPADFQRTDDELIQQFIHGRAQGPMET